jgi:hypothetical protein
MRSKSSIKPKFDSAVLDDLARCYARAAVDRMIDEAQPEPETKKSPPRRKRKKGVRK